MESNDYILKVLNLNVEIRNQIILDNVSFTLRKGAILAIVGPNGSGKTTLFRAMLNRVPYSGKIDWSEKVKIGYVPQNLSMGDIPISVKEFLEFKSGSNIETALSSVGLDSKELQTKSLNVLSGGQLRRVLIAWAIIDRPNVLLFDEPTAGINVQVEESIYKMLSELREKNRITILLISHDVHIVREYSDFMLALNKCMIFFGDSEEIMNPSLQHKIYGEAVCTQPYNK